jgi:hypothetical protein
VRPYLEKTFHKKELAEWLKVKDLSSNPSTAKKKKKRIYVFSKIYLLDKIIQTRIILALRI